MNPDDMIKPQTIDKLKTRAEAIAKAPEGADIAPLRKDFLTALRSVPEDYYLDTLFSLQMKGRTVLYSEPSFDGSRELAWTASTFGRNGNETRTTEKPVSRAFWEEAARNIVASVELRQIESQRALWARTKAHANEAAVRSAEYLKLEGQL